MKWWWEYAFCICVYKWKSRDGEVFAETWVEIDWAKWCRSISTRVKHILWSLLCDSFSIDFRWDRLESLKLRRILKSSCLCSKVFGFLSFYSACGTYKSKESWLRRFSITKINPTTWKYFQIFSFPLCGCQG